VTQDEGSALKSCEHCDEPSVCLYVRKAVERLVASLEAPCFMALCLVILIEIFKVIRQMSLVLLRPQNLHDRHIYIGCKP
jgi:hypothetical protein